MKIETVQLKIPSLKVTNDTIMEYLEKLNPDVPKIKIKSYQRIVSSLIKKAGSKERYYRDLENGEKASDHITDAIKSALDKSGLKPNDIDLLIYCGVGRGFLEPANAYFYANAMGMKHTHCFDIVDACMSWIRALEISYQYIRSGTHKHIMIVNGEFNAYEHGLPEVFKIKNLKQATYSFPAYTIGEASTATILTPSDQTWEFNYRSFPEMCNVCTIPLEGHSNYVEKHEYHGLNGLYKFVSFGGKLFEHASNNLTPFVKDVVKNLDEPRIYFPHAASDLAYLASSNSIGINNGKMYTKVFPTIGNVVSASVPAGITMALKEDILKRGDKIVFCPASAGSVYAVVQLTY